MRVEYLITGFVVFSLMILTGGAMIGNMANNYQVTYNTKDVAFNDSFNVVSQMSDITNQTSNSVFYNFLSTIDPTSTILIGAYNAWRIIPNTYHLLTGIIDGVCQTWLGGGNGALTCSMYESIANTVLVIFMTFTMIYILVTRYIAP
jgi:hypothetical protein